MAREIETKTQLRATVNYLEAELADYKAVNRQLLTDLTELRIENAKLKRKVELYECESAVKREEPHD